MDGIHKVKTDFWHLSNLLENYPIDQFISEFNRISDSYLNSEFDPDSFFPNKVELKRRLDAIIDNLSTTRTLAKQGIDASEYISNIEAAIAICASIKGMKWVKETPEWTIQAGEIRIMEVDE